MLTFWKGTQDHHSLGSSSPYLPPFTFTVLILASSTSETREHIKLLDRLSEPSAQLIRLKKKNHPSRIILVSSVFESMVSQSATLSSARRLLVSTLHPRTQLGSK